MKSIVQEIKDSVSQKSIMPVEISDYVPDNLDFSLSKYFYNYLSGLDDRLPVYSYIDSIIERSVTENKHIKEDFLRDTPVSCGMGMVVTCKSNSKGLYLRLLHETPLTKINVIKEVISPDRHDIYKVGSEGLLPMDDSYNSKFKEERVLSLQGYLSDYMRQEHSISFRSSK